MATIAMQLENRTDIAEKTDFSLCYWICLIIGVTGANERQ
jgi:hypothetical protein